LYMKFGSGAARRRRQPARFHYIDRNSARVIGVMASKKRAVNCPPGGEAAGVMEIDGAFGQIDDAARSDDGSDAAAASGDQAVADAERRIERVHRDRAGEQSP